MSFNQSRVLGKTNLEVGCLGIASSYGAPAHAYEEAFERGCNYFTWGSFFRGKSSEMETAIKNIIKSGKRDKLVLATYGYTHTKLLNNYSLVKSLKKLNIYYFDVFILGYYNNLPGEKVLQGAMKLKEKGLVRFLAVSSHNRKLFCKLEQENLFDIYHLRYNAAHRGAENDVFPCLNKENKTGIVAYTATRWGQLLNEKKMPLNEKPLSVSDCYRFVLSNKSVDVCMTGPKNLEQMRENLTVLDSKPLSEEELHRIRRIGDYVYNKKTATH